MRQSKLFGKTLREDPKDEVAVNARLLERGGFVYKTMAGVYDYLPLGFRVLEKIKQIIREEMNAIGGQELFLSSLQRPEVWAKTGRWQDDAIDVWFKTKLKNGHELGLATTHEEPLTEIATRFVGSYKDLPLFIYQFQTKFRNELRPQGGILRTREFIMKDLYSFSRDETEHRDFYEKVKSSYKTVFNRLGIGDKTFVTFASGGTFSKYSHEFQAVCEAGEDTIYLDRKRGIAVNKEVFTDAILRDLGLEKSRLEQVKAVEVGNIFSLGTRFSEALGLRFIDEKGKEHPVVMGSYGIGPGRVVGTIVEICHDDKGIVWPESVAPFKVHLIGLQGAKGKSLAVKKSAEKLYKILLAKGVEVLYDDRELKSAGEKFADADLIGLPLRAVISASTIAQKGIEVKKRSEREAKIISVKELLELASC